MKKVITVIIIIAVLAGLAFYFYKDYKHDQEMKYPKFYSGNGRLEATEVFVASKLAGRIEKIYVKSGSLIKKGDKLVQMQTNTLEAQKASTLATIKVQESNLEMAKATVLLKQTSLKGAKKEFDRQKKMLASKATSLKNYDDAETKYNNAVAELKYTEASVGAAEGQILQAKADLQKIEADIADSLLTAKYDGRVEYVLAHEGEVLSPGGRVLNVVDLTDAYMTFFLPTKIAGQVTMGAEVKLIFDASPNYAVAAKVSFIDPIAQFTPKSVETKVEREKLMFRIKAHLDAEELRKYIDFVKTGLPGVAWVKLDPNASWDDTPVELPKTYYNDKEFKKPAPAAKGK